MTEFPYYLGYGEETGAAAGEGFNLNLPLPPGTAWSTYGEALQAGLARLRNFGPDALVQEDQVAAFDAPVADGLVEGKGYGRGRGVGMALDGDHHFFLRQAKFSGGAVENALVGLMGHQPVDVFGGEAVGVERFTDDGRQVFDRVAKDLAPDHAYMTDGLGR